MSNSSGYYREICSEEQANILGLFLRQPWGFHTHRCLSNSPQEGLGLDLDESHARFLTHGNLL